MKKLNSTQCKTFVWQGFSAAGKRTCGKITAINAEIASQLLSQQRITPIKIIEKSIPSPRLFSLRKKSPGKIKPKHILNFIKELATLINANIPLITALKMLSNEPKQNQLLTAVLLSIQNSVASGTQLHQAFKKYPKYFDAFFCNLIHIGEQSGTLDHMLNHLSAYMEKADKQKRQIFKAMLYPSMVLIVALAVTAILLIFVIPQFKQMFTGFGATLPAYTQFIINLAEFAQKRAWIILLSIGTLLFAFKLLLHNNQTFSHKIDGIKLKLPIVGTLIQKAILAQFSNILAITFKTGIPIIETLTLTATIVQNWVYQQSILNIRQEITSGKSLYLAFQAQKIFPNKMLQFIAIGEESGTLDNMLNEIAKTYADEITFIAENINNLIEPLIIIVLGVLVGGLLIGMYLPIFRLGTAI